MTAEEIYTERLTNTDTIALATLNLEGNAPRVRTVNMVYLPETPNTIYFTSNGQSAKTKEFLVHDTVSSLLMTSITLPFESTKVTLSVPTTAMRSSRPWTLSTNTFGTSPLNSGQNW